MDVYCDSKESFLKVFAIAAELFLNQLNQYIQGIPDEFTGENES